MRLRSKVMVLAAAALAGFLVSRQDIRYDLNVIVEEFKLKINNAIKSGQEEAAIKEQQLNNELIDKS